MQDRQSIVKLPVYGSGGKMAYTGTAATSSAFSGAISGVWVTCSTDAWAKLDVAAVATAPTDFFCPANQMVFIPVPANVQDKCVLSVVQDASGGNAFYCAGV